MHDIGTSKLFEILFSDSREKYASSSRNRTSSRNLNLAFDLRLHFYPLLALVHVDIFAKQSMRVTRRRLPVEREDASGEIILELLLRWRTQGSQDDNR